MAVRKGVLCAVLLSLILGASTVLAGEGGEKLFNFNIASKVPVTFYGYVKLDAAWDDSRVSVGNFARWVENEGTNRNDEEFNMTANQTRLGLKIGGEDVGGMKPSARVEIDFYGVAAAENKPGVLLRHAYAKLDWEELDLSLIAGQTSDLISPLFAPTVNYTVGWWQGNIGYRRPQLRLTKGFSIDTDVLTRIELATALTRNIGHAGDFDPGDSGEDSGLPGVQWRIGTTWKILTDKPTKLGFYGSFHQEEYDVAADNTDEDLDSDMIGIDLTLPLLDWLDLKGEWFKGRNLDTFLGGVGQGAIVNAAGRAHEVSTEGGWLALSMRPPIDFLEKFTFNAGVGIDDPDDDDVAEGARTRNFMYFFNTFYNLGGGASVGLEFMRLETQYEGDNDDGEAGRVQFTVIYKF
jgi:hypothetical protein